MRYVLFTIGALGFALIMGAVFLTIDHMVTDDHRAVVQDKITSATESIEDSKGRKTRGLRGALASAKALSNGIFRSAPISLDLMLPPPPQGWTRVDYQPAHGEQLTGIKAVRSLLSLGSTQDSLYVFEKAAKRRNMGAVATYQNGDFLILMRMETEMSRFRTLENGPSNRRDRLLSPARTSGTSYGTRSGIRINLEPQFSTTNNPDGTSTTVAVDHRRFTFGIGRIVEAEILTNAPDDVMIAFFRSFDVSAFQSILPRPTDDYDPMQNAFLPQLEPEPEDEEQAALSPQTSP